jgi:hypothetical protein
MRLSRVYGLAA